MTLRMFLGGIPIRRCMLVRGSSALVCLAGLFVVRMGVLVSFVPSFLFVVVVDVETD